MSIVKGQGPKSLAYHYPDGTIVYPNRIQAVRGTTPLQICSNSSESSYQLDDSNNGSCSVSETRPSNVVSRDSCTNPKQTENSFASSTSTSSTISLESRMEELMKDMKTFSEQRNAEIQDYKRKCQDQEIMISSIKQCLNMDKVEADLETYKQTMSSKIKSLEDEKLKIENTKKTLKRKHDRTTKDLNIEKSLRISAESSCTDLLEKIDDLTKQLEAEKVLRKAVEEEVISLKSQIVSNEDDNVIPNKHSNDVPMNSTSENLTNELNNATKPISLIIKTVSDVTSSTVVEQGNQKGRGKQNCRVRNLVNA